MQIITIANQKGGVGKTTTAVTLSHRLALAGYQTLLVDLDAQGNCCDALGLEKEGDLYRFLIEDDGEDCISAARDNLSIIMGDKTTAAAKQILAGRDFREQTLKNALSEIEDFDFCILDAAPGVDVLQIAGLVASDYFLIPAALDHLAVVGAGDALASVASLSQIGSLSARLLGVLPTMWERTTNESQEQLEHLIAQFKRLVWPPIPRDVKAREAPAYGQTLYEYAPNCRALCGVEMDNGRRLGGYEQVLERLLEEI